MTLKAGIYDPYLDTLGGGERYCLTVGEILSQHGYQVDLFWSGNSELLTQAQARFDLDLSSFNLVPDIFKNTPDSVDIAESSQDVHQVTHTRPNRLDLLHQISQFINKIKVTRQYDVLFFLSDWSLPFIFARHNLLHIQVPFARSPHFTTFLTNRLKTLFLQEIICNSHFTQKFAQGYFGQKCSVIYPPVDVEKFDPHQPRLNQIISVGRFDDILNIKKQDVLIEAFKLFISQNPHSDWRLILAGGSLESVDKNRYLKHLQHLSVGYPIEFLVNPDFSRLKQIYSQSKIYWHAAGYQIDESAHPEHTEHFGMTPVEAMASGLVPVLVNKGGLPEIITDKVSGYLWNDISELVAKTQLLVASPSTWSTMSQAALDQSQKFSKQNFSNQLSSIISL